MSELLVRVIDKVNDDFYLDLQCTKRGDVIAVKPDGWAWTTAELKNPEWRIIVVDMKIDEAQIYLRPQDDGKDSFDQTKSKTLLRREIGFNLDSAAIPIDVKEAIDDSARTDDKIDAIDLNVKDIEVVKSFVVDPSPIVIGP